MSNPDLIQEVKQLIIDELCLEDLTPADINADDALFGEGLGLDSIDALELGVAIKKKYNITLDADAEETKQHFASVTALCKLIESHA